MANEAAESLWTELRVVQAGGSAACGFAAKLLVDLGADCVLLESRGDTPGDAGAAAERTFLHWGKRSVAWDAAGDDAFRALATLAGTADVLIHDGLPAPLHDRWQASRSERAPGLIELAITPFGTSGPYADYLGDNGAYQALAGLAYTSGDPDREPLITGPNVAEYFAGAHGFAAVLSALTRRRDTSEGCSIDLSALDATVAFDEYNLILAAALGVSRTRFYSRVILGYPSDVFACSDGHLVLLGAGTYDALPLMIERPDLIGSPLFSDPQQRAERWREIEALLAPWCRAHARDEIIARAQELRIRAAPVLGIEELLEHPHVRHRGSIVRAEDADGSFALPVPPFRLRSYRPRAGPAPRPGEHTDGASAWPERSGTALPPSGRDAPAHGGGALPLSGVRVLDFTHVWAGPACTRILSDLGADVIKVEGPGRIDLTRNIFLTDNDTGGEFWEHSLYFQNRNQGKRSIAVDLAHEEGRRLIKRLVAACDVVVENFTPRVMPAFGLDYPALSAVQPRLVMLSMSGYGASGPFADHTALGMSLDGSCGLASGNGYRDGLPQKCGTAILDPFAGVCGAAAIMAALLERDRDGRGQYIDLSQHEAGMSLVGPWIVETSRSGRAPERRGNRSGRHAPQGVYPCAGEDQWLYLSVHGEGAWRRACELLGDPALATDLKFATAEARLAHHDNLDDRLAALTAKWEKRALMDALQRAGVVAAALLDGAEVLTDPQLAARGTFERVRMYGADRDLPSQRYVPARFTCFDPRPAEPVARLGAHNREVLRELAGIGDAECEALERDGILATEPVLALPIEEMRVALRSPVESWLAQDQARRVPAGMLTEGSGGGKGP